MAVRALLRAWLIALVLLPIGGALSARADDGRPSDAVGPPPTPPPVPQSGLRPSEIDVRSTPISEVDSDLAPSRVPLRSVSKPRRELVLFVGGYGSQSNDRAFDELGDRFPADRYEVLRLGDDQRFPYDTYGSLDSNAAVLTEQVRAVASEYAAVNIVAHSMGGAVVDRAFRNGLSANDGVRTYVAIAGAHNGADFARVPSAALPRLAPVSDIIRAVAVLLARDPDSPAARDLATARPIPPPPGVVRLDLTLATDGLVNRYDGLDPGVEKRVFLPASPGEIVNGHGGSLTNREIADVVVETIREKRLPPDRRDQLTVFLAPMLWDRFTTVWRLILVGLLSAGIALWLARYFPRWRRLIDLANAYSGHFLRAVGR